jgi:ankyrin repeat protein
MDLKELPARPCLEQYKKQAKDLVKAYKSNDSEAIRRIKNNHPRLDNLPDSDIRNAKFSLADAQLVIARENGFPSWTKFKEFLLFRVAVQALDAGGRTGVAEFLLEQGVDPRSQINSGQTGLHYAAHAGHLETVKMLLERKVPLEVKNMYDGTVLGQALWSAFNEPKPDHLPIIEALIAAGAKVEPDWNKWIDELRQHNFRVDLE